MESPKFRLPGFVWTALIALIPLLVTWLQGAYFAGQQWTAIVIIALGALAKLIEVTRSQPADATARDAFSAAPSRSAFNRFLLG